MRAPLSLRITEVFTSLQGEALTSGLPTTFIRLTGCPLRCVYCDSDYAFQGGEQRSVVDLVNTSKTSGANLVCVTGGEPLVRAHLPELVERLALLGVDTALTTNGATLRMHAKALAEAGLKRINISLDSLQPERFLELTRRDELDRVLDGIEAAVDAGLKPVKINAVMMRGINDDEIVDFAEFGRDKGLTVRFIEFMPLEAGDVWNEDLVVPADEIVEKINKAIPIEPIVRGSEPAERWRYLDGKGEVGVIASVTKPFCGDCDRVRLTAEGQFRTCLFAVDEFDMRSLLRSEANDEENAKAIVDAVGTKWAGHSIGQVNFIRPSRTMSQIGG